jgi:predicted nucleic acid-binding protein
MLVDTSVWIDHLRRGHAALSALLEALPQAEVAHHDEVMAFVETHRLMGSGVGWVDVHLLASAKLGDVSIWTADARLKKAAIRLGLYPEPAPAEK